MHVRSRASRRALGRSVSQILGRIACLESLESRVLMTTEMATWSDAFVSSIGVNTKPTGYNYLYSNQAQVEADLKDIGIRNIRGDLNWLPDKMNTSISSSVPIKELAMVDTDHKAHTYAEYQTIIANDLTAIKNAFTNHKDRLLGIEGPNELDLQNPDPNWKTDIPVINQIAYQLIRSDSFFDGIPYIGCSLGARSSLQYLEVQGDTTQGQYADAANAHSYTTSFAPGYNAQDSSAQLSSGAETYGLPVWMPETGYSTTTSTDSKGKPLGLPLNAQARYVLRTFLDNYNAGIVQTYWFEFADTWNDGDWAGHLGLITMNSVNGTYTYKPSATALKNMISVLSDPNNGVRYTAGGLDYSMSAPSDINHMLLQKADGTFELVLWQETAYTGDAPTGGESVTLTFNTAVNSSVTQFIPTVSANGTTLTMNANRQLTLDVNDGVTIIQLTPSSRPTSAPAAPTNVNVSGQNSSTFANVSWTGSANADGYVVERKGTDGVWTVVGKTTTATSFTDTGLIPGRAFAYRVWAANDAGGNVTGAVSYLPPVGNLTILPMNTSTMYDYGNITITNASNTFIFCNVPTVALTPGYVDSYIAYRQPGLTSFQVTIDGNLWEKQGGDYGASISTDGVQWTPVACTTIAGLFGEDGRPSVWFLSPSSPLPAGTSYVRFDMNTQDSWKQSAFALVKLWSTNSVPTGWSDSDIGSTAPTPAGSASSANGVYAISGGGSDIWGSSDQFNYSSQSVNGDQTIIARVTDLTNTNASAKAGVMLRDSTAANAMFAMANVKPNGGIEFLYRKSTGGSVAYGGGGSSGTMPSLLNPVWVKLVKSGTSISAYYATGTSVPTGWTQAGTTQTISLANTNYRAGLAVCSHANGTLATGVFDNITIAAAPSSVAFQINDGSAQRSMVSSLTLTFDQPVMLTSDAISLVLRSGGNIPFTLSPTSSYSRSYTLTFGGLSLADGIYDLSVKAGSVQDAYGQSLSGGDRTSSFHRLFGDINGDGYVDAYDSRMFRLAMGSSPGAQNYLAAFDVNNDGYVDAYDSRAFRAQMGKSLLV